MLRPANQLIQTVERFAPAADQPNRQVDRGHQTAPLRYDLTAGRQFIITTPGEYSMETAVAILKWLAQRDRCVITDDGWRTSGYGNLVEVGMDVQLDNIVIHVMCSYEDILFTRVSGNKEKFDALCEKIRGLGFEAT